MNYILLNLKHTHLAELSSERIKIHVNSYYQSHVKISRKSIYNYVLEK